MELEFYKCNHLIKDNFDNVTKILKLFKEFVDYYSDDEIRQYIIDNQFDIRDYPPPTRNKIIEGYVDFFGEKKRLVDFIIFEYDEKGEIIHEKLTDKIKWKIMANYIITKYHLEMLDYLVKESYHKISSDLRKTIQVLTKYKRCLTNPTISKNEIQYEIDKLDNLEPDDIQNDIYKLEKWVDRITELNSNLRNYYL